MPEANPPPFEELARRLEGRVVLDASLADHTTLKVGGPAAALVTAEDDADLALIGQLCRDRGLPWMVVGRGSNLLIADAGWPGVAIALGRGFRGVEIDGTLVRAGAAEPMPILAAKVADAGLTGFAWGGAVPGSVGGGVRMNAGAHGVEMREVLVEAELFRLHIGTREIWPTSQLGLSYRHSMLPTDAIVVAASLRLQHGDADVVRDDIAEIKRWRREHQPINEPNCGSVFTNPPGASAGQMVDAVGGKELRVGGAAVSQVHANFIVTSPGATAADVRALIRTLRERVHATYDVWLRPEVAMYGEFDDEGLGDQGLGDQGLGDQGVPTGGAA